MSTLVKTMTSSIVCGVLLLAASPVMGAEWLTADEVKELFSGKTSISVSMTKDRRYITYYGLDGMLGQDRNGERLQGKWWVLGDGQHCIQKNGKTYCRFIKNDNGVYNRYKQKKNGKFKHVQTYKEIIDGNPRNLKTK